MSTTKAAMVLARAKAEGPMLALDDPAIERLTERFLELHQQAFRDAVDTVVELGQILVEARPLLSGNFYKWLDRLGVSPKTARNYESLARMSPLIIAKFKELGPSKLYRIGQMTPEGRKQLFRRQSNESLGGMTDREFATATKHAIVKKRKVTPDMVAHGLRMKLRAWTTTLEGYRMSGIKNPDIRAGLLKELGLLARATATLTRDVKSDRGGGRSRSKTA